MEGEHVVKLMLELTSLRNLRDLVKIPGLTTMKVDEKWTIKINAHREEIDGVAPYEFGVWYNGWPAGSFSPMGEGILAAGEAANKETFRAAVKVAIEKETEGATR